LSDKYFFEIMKMEFIPKVIFKIQTFQIDKELKMKFDKEEKCYLCDSFENFSEIVNNKYLEEPLSLKPSE